MKKTLFLKVFIMTNLFLLCNFLLYDVWWFIPFLLIHEGTHCLVGEYLGYTLEKVKLLPFGLKANFLDEYIKPRDDILISASGPLINFVFFILFKFIEYATGNDIYIVRDINFILFIFNLIPAGFLDGSRILKGFLKINFNFYYSYFITELSGFIFGGIIALTAFYRLFSFKGIFLLGLGIYFIYTSYTASKEIIINVIKDTLYKQRYILENNKLTIILKAYNYNSRLLDIIKGFSFNKYYVIYIIEKGVLGKKFNEGEIIDMYYRYGNIKIGECIIH